MRYTVSMAIAILVLIGIVYGAEAVGYSFDEGSGEYRTWTYQYWRDRYPDLEIDEATLAMIEDNFPSGDFKSIEARYLDNGSVKIVVEMYGDALDRDEMLNLRENQIVYALGGFIKFRHGDEIVSVRVDYFIDPVLESQAVNLWGFVYTGAVHTVEDFVNVDLKVLGNKYVFTLSIPENLRPLTVLDGNISTINNLTSIILFEAKISYFWDVTAQQFDFMDDIFAVTYGDYLSSRTSPEDSLEDNRGDVNGTEGGNGDINNGETDVEQPPMDSGGEETGEDVGGDGMLVTLFAAAVVGILLVAGYYIYRARGG